MTTTYYKRVDGLLVECSEKEYRGSDMTAIEFIAEKSGFKKIVSPNGSVTWEWPDGVTYSDTKSLPDDLRRATTTSKFWDKVERCMHQNLSPHFLESIYCMTPYCDGDETHCMDCGVFIQKCGCGFNDGLSGWPVKRIKGQS